MPTKNEKHYITEIKHLMEEWDYEANVGINPENITLGSNRKVWWKCNKCGGRWQATICDRTRKDSTCCPYCASQKVLAGYNDLATKYPELLKQWHPTKNGELTPYDVTAGRFNPVWWKCQKCGYEWQSSPNNRKKGIGCPCCAGRVPQKGVNDLKTKYPDIAKDWDYEKNYPLVPEDFLPGSGKTVWWKCSICGKSWQIAVRQRVRGLGKCPHCTKKQLELKFFHDSTC